MLCCYYMTYKWSIEIIITISVLHVYFIHIRDICEHVKLDAFIQYNGLFSIQFCNNHNLTITLMLYIAQH